MMPPPRRSLLRRWLAVLAGVVLLVLIGRALDAVGRSVVVGRIQSLAAARGLAATWEGIEFGLPARARIHRLVLVDAMGDTVFSAERIETAARWWSVLMLHPELGNLTLRHARWTRQAAPAEADTLAPESEPPPPRRDRPERVRQAAGTLVRLMLLPARALPRLEVRDLSIVVPGEETPFIVTIARLDVIPRRGGVRLASQGVVELDHPVPYDMSLDYGNDDRLSGGARLEIPMPESAASRPLRISVDGQIAQNRRHGRISLGPGTRVTIGRIPIWITGSVSREGPHVRFALFTEGVTGPLVQASFPAPILGPLRELAVRGSFDYRLGLDLDVARPDSVSFTADVVPHDLAINPVSTRLDLLRLDDPFLATIHLPHDVVVTRDLSPLNPHYRPLDEIDSLLVAAVVTNEDGAFYRHRGFNVEAVKQSIATNLKAGAYRRGAGTITMQLARNLYLGHARTLSRKAQEVVLAWVLEHLTGVSKRRLLEIYLNIIEWGPGVQGADEAAWYYFDHDAGSVTVPEALFLATVVPSPRRWRNRVEPDGTLRPFERAQMHFIGRAMIRSGALAPDSLPPADSLRVALRGEARLVLLPPATPAPAALDSIAEPAVPAVP